MMAIKLRGFGSEQHTFEISAKYSSFILILRKIVSINCHIYRSHMSVASMFPCYGTLKKTNNPTKLQFGNDTQSVAEMSHFYFKIIIFYIYKEFTA